MRSPSNADDFDSTPRAFTEVGGLRRSNAASAIERAFDHGAGILRLAPAWVPRSFCVPGRRIRLHPDDLFALGGERGRIDERWLASSIRADNGPLTGPDEGLSLVVGPEGEALGLDDVAAVLGAELVGERIWTDHGCWPVYSKFFDNRDRLPFHLHLRSEHAALVGRTAKPEAYFFPAQMNNHLGEDPETYFGLRPGTTREQLAQCLADFGRRGDNRVTELSLAYRLELDTGWDIPAGIVHAPGSLCTYEPQAASDVFAMYESWSAGQALPEELLWKDVPTDRHGDVDYLLSLLDWEVNTDPDFAAARMMRPIAVTGEPGSQAERWIVYRSPYFSAKRLVIEPGAAALVTDAAAYGCIASRGAEQSAPRPWSRGR